MLIRSDTIFVYWLTLQITSDENVIRGASKETNASLLYDTEKELHKIEIAEYNLGNRVRSQLFQEYVDNNARYELDRCLQKGLARTITTGVSLENQNKQIGSWTDCNEKVMNVEQRVYFSIYQQKQKHLNT